MEVKSLPHIESMRFEGITFAHPGQEPILRNCDFEFKPGKALWLKSPEGAGKSTLLQILAGLSLPQHGSYFLNDQNVVEMSFEDFLPFRLRIGFTFDYGGLINNRTIQDNLMLPLVYHKLLPADVARERVMELIERFDLTRFSSERPAHVPGRVRKIAVLLRALVMAPQLLLLDDPSVGLSDNAQAEYLRYIRELQEEGILKFIVVGSYDDRFMAQIPHDIIHMDEGALYHQPGTEESKVVGL